MEQTATVEKEEVQSEGNGHAVAVKPDREFISLLRKAGGDNVKKCYQCATCSVVCNLSTEDQPFPRKEMIWAQWGIKDKLMYNPSVWLCHMCADCSNYCPRGARPSDVIGAIRSLTYRYMSVPSFLGKLLTTPAMAIVSLAIPALIVLGLLLGVNGKFPLEKVGAAIEFHRDFLRIGWVDTIFLSAAGFAVVFSALNIRKFWQGLAAHNPQTAKVGIGAALIGAITDILLHRKFNKCETNKQMSLAHMLTFYAFILLFITTGTVVVYIYGGVYFNIFSHDAQYQKATMELSNPAKIIGNIGAVLGVLGISFVLIRRLVAKDAMGGGSFADWMFTGVVFTVMVTGVLTEVARFQDLVPLVYIIYYIHLVFVLFLFIYLPFSKFAHMLYRTTAMVFARTRGIKEIGA